MRPPSRLVPCLLLFLAGGLAAEERRAFLILDLDGDGLYLGDLAYPVRFDVEGDGVSEPVSWTAVGRREAFLWIDRNGNGRVDDGRELMGAPATGVDSFGAAFESLAALDHPDQGGDGDGRLTAADRQWSDLGLWIDGDHDGRSRPEELARPEAWGITVLELEPRRQAKMDGSANVFRAVTGLRRGSRSAGRVFEVELARGRD